MRSWAVLLSLAIAATASAQGTKTPATKAADTTKVGTRAAPPTKTAAPATKTAAPQTKADGQTKAANAGAPQGATKGAGRPGLAVTPEQAQRPRAPVIMREIFDYDAEGRRDPFFTLLASNELRPTVSDLKLIGILYDPSGRRSVVTLRDLQTNARYQVTTGTVLGRMRVVLIKPKAVFFAIEEFGLNRQDSLVLGDTTKARAR
jgi:hypothetical protein